MNARLRNVIDPRPAHLRDRPLLNGVILLALIGLVVYMALTHNIPIINGKPGERLRADFAFANQVLPHQTPVRVNGVEVGKVDKIDAGPDPRRSTRVEMRITDDSIVVHEDARAEIRWRTLLGGRMYIDLEPGSARSPRKDDWVIPVAQTANQVEFDDLLQPYDGGTEQAQRDVLHGLSETLEDPRAVRAAVDALPGLETVGRGARPYLGTQAGDLRGVVAATATTVKALGADTGALQQLVTGARQTLAATTAQRQNLGEFLEQSPPSLDETQATMTRVRTTLDHLDPLADRLRPGARKLASAANAAQPALDEAAALLREARPLLTDARPTFDDLGAAARSAVPVIQGLEPTVDRLNKSILPWLDERDGESEMKNYEGIGPFFSVLNMAAAEYDQVGYRLHLSTPAASNSVLTIAQKAFAAQCERTARSRRARIGCDADGLGARTRLVRTGEEEVSRAKANGNGKSGLDRERIMLEIRRAARPFAVMIVFLACTAAAWSVIIGNIGLSWPWTNSYETRVALDNAAGVVPQKQGVRLAGIEVGLITKLDVVNGQAVATIKLDEDKAPLYRDARLRLRPETPLNDIYLDVEKRGTPGAGKLEQGRHPARRAHACGGRHRPRAQRLQRRHAHPPGAGDRRVRPRSGRQRRRLPQCARASSRRSSRRPSG